MTNAATPAALAELRAAGYPVDANTALEEVITAARLYLDATRGPAAVFVTGRTDLEEVDSTRV